jgi:hypothetical protein
MKRLFAFAYEYAQTDDQVLLRLDKYLKKL